MCHLYSANIDNNTYCTGTSNFNSRGENSQPYCILNPQFYYSTRNFHFQVFKFSSRDSSNLWRDFLTRKAVSLAAALWFQHSVIRRPIVCMVCKENIKQIKKNFHQLQLFSCHHLLTPIKYFLIVSLKLSYLNLRKLYLYIPHQSSICWE